MLRLQRVRIGPLHLDSLPLGMSPLPFAPSSQGAGGGGGREGEGLYLRLRRVAISTPFLYLSDTEKADNFLQERFGS